MFCQCRLQRAPCRRKHAQSQKVKSEIATEFASFTETDARTSLWRQVPVYSFFWLGWSRSDPTWCFDVIVEPCDLLALNKWEPVAGWPSTHPHCTGKSSEPLSANMHTCVTHPVPQSWPRPCPVGSHLGRFNSGCPSQLVQTQLLCPLTNFSKRQELKKGYNL